MKPVKTPLDQVAVESLKGVGPRMAEKLAQLGIFTVQDILFHLPLRYQDRTRITPIGAVQPGSDVVIEGEIKAADVVFGRRRSLLCRLQDGTGTLTLRFFHFSAAQKQSLLKGSRLRCFGEARRGASGLELVHPEYQRVDAGHPLPMDATLTAVYPSSEGLHQASWRKLCAQALQLLDHHHLSELLPTPLAMAGTAISLEQAIIYLHQPPVDVAQSLLREGLHPCQRRLAFEELLAHNLSLLRLRQTTRAHGAPALNGRNPLAEQFLQQLPFSLTGAQARVAREIEQDLQQAKPMLRLVQGDVGSGKTVVAALAALQAVANGYQVAIMAPTEILAEQHFANFSE